MVLAFKSNFFLDLFTNTSCPVFNCSTHKWKVAILYSCKQYMTLLAINSMYINLNIQDVQLEESEIQLTDLLI